MSINCHKEVGDLLYLLRDSLCLPVIEEFERIYGTQYVREIEVLLETQNYSLPHEVLDDTESIVQSLDIYRILKLIRSRWYVFKFIFNSRDDIDLVFQARNDWAHQVPFSNSRAQDTALSCINLLSAVGAENEVREAQIVIDRLSRQLAEQQKTTFSEPIQRIHENIVQLTQQQFKVILELTGKNRVAITGCAGSGKTLVAAEKSVRLSNAGLKCLLLCHNPLLADYLKTLTAGTSIVVYDFQSWIAHLTEQREPCDRTWTHYHEPTDDELNQAFDFVLGCEDKFDAIVVDEGQDFRSEWWIIVESALISQDSGILYIFHDDNQALLPLRAKYPVDVSVHKLSKNCRNAAEIFEFVKRFHPQSPEPEVTLQGGSIRYHSFTDDWRTAISEAVEVAFHESTDLIAITTEEVVCKESVLNGLQSFPSQEPEQTWQYAVNYFFSVASKRLRGREPSAPEIELPQFSKDMLPNSVDVRKVNDFAQYLLLADGPLDAELTKFLNERQRRSDVKCIHENGRLVLQLRPQTVRQEIGNKIILKALTTNRWIDMIPLPQNIRFEAYGNLFTVSDYKGLEANNVLLFVPSPRSDLESYIYVAASRARIALYIVANKSVEVFLPKITLFL